MVLLPPLDWGGANGRQAHYSTGQTDRKGGAGPKGPVSLVWGKKGLVGRWTHPKCTKVWEVNWSF